MVRGTPAYLKSFVAVLSTVPELGVGDTDALLDELYLIGHQSSRDQEAALHHQGHGDCNEKHSQNNVHSGLTRNDQHMQRDFYSGTTCVDFLYWLVNHVFPGMK